MTKFTDPLEALTDAASYETLQKESPKLLESVSALMRAGAKAKDVERWARRNYGQGNLIALLVAGAAHHIEKQKYT
jgi:hypothetical protein